MQFMDTQKASKKKLRCVVANCENRGRHQFPKDEVRRKQWIEAIKHVKPGTTISAYSLICSDHFKITDFSVIPSYWNNYYPGRNLRRTVVPSVFPWNKTSVEVKLEQPSSSVQVKLEQPSSSIQDTLSFNPARVKASYSKARPTVLVKEQNQMVSMGTDNPHKTSKKKLLCIVDYCDNEGRHKFPKNEVRRRRWIEAIKHLKPRMAINANSIICSDHFRLSVFPWKTSVEVKLEPTSSSTQDELDQPSSSIQVKVEKVSPCIQDKQEQPSSSIQVKQEKPSSSFEVELEQPPPSIQVKLEPTSSSIQDKLEQPSSSIQVKVEKPSSSIEVELEPLTPSIQDTISFNPDQVKPTNSKALPTVLVKKQNFMVSMLTDNPYKISKKKLQLRIAKQCRCVVADCANKGRHQFPKNEGRRRQWIEAIKHIKPGMTINPRSLICSDHFQVSDFSITPSHWNNYYSSGMLRRNVVPSVFPWNKTSIELKQEEFSFNPDKVKATYTRAQPTVFVEEQNYIVPTATVDPHEDPLQLNNSILEESGI